MKDFSIFHWLIVAGLFYLGVRLFGKKSKPFEHTGPGTFQVEVVGESNYQDALESICGGKNEESANHQCRAVLILEDGNKYDKKAVRVDIDGKVVGYLGREVARAYRKQLNPPARVTVAATIRGGWKRKGDAGSYGVWLDI